MFVGWKMVLDVTYTGTSWTAVVVGRTKKLQQEAGRRYLRECDLTLGTSPCSANLTALDYIRTGCVVSNVSESRIEWTATALSMPVNVPASTGGVAFDDDFFREGEATFTTGDNAGVTRPIARYTHATRQFRTYVPFPYDITSGDEFTVKPGCDGTNTTCATKFALLSGTTPLVNMNGDPFVPSTQQSLAYPDP